MTLAAQLARRVPALARLLFGQTLFMADDGVLQEDPPARIKRGSKSRPEGSPALSRAMAIPCPDPTSEDRLRDAHQAHGQALARQEAWDDIAAALAANDIVRARTPGGLSVADLVAYGARADVVAAAEHALMSGEDEDIPALLEGIAALEAVLTDRPNCPYTATIVAQAHMDLGWAWRGTGPDDHVSDRHREAFMAHFDRAAEILKPYEGETQTSILIASAICALSASQPRRAGRIARDHEALIDLDPSASRVMRTLGTRLLPRWNGSYEDLEVAARRVAARTQSTWGSGGYTWVMFDAIATDDEACSRVDLDFFLEGLSDILDRARDQHSVNLLAAYCAVTMGQRPETDSLGDAVRARIAACAAPIVRKHLTELHPMIWAHAARNFDNALRVRSPERFAAAGYADAISVIADLFRGDGMIAGRADTYGDTASTA